jgi:hypothetical protein
MRLIAQFANYRIQVRPMRVRGLGDGTSETLQEPIYLTFEHEGLMYDNEVREARETFALRGQYQHRDEATPVDPIYRFSVFDTKNIADEADREIAEAFMLDQKAKGNTDFIIVETTSIPRPWPNYDRIKDPKKIVAKVVEDGYTVQDVIDYEKLFGQNRADVIEALEAIETDEVVVVA